MFEFHEKTRLNGLSSALTVLAIECHAHLFIGTKYSIHSRFNGVVKYLRQAQTSRSHKLYDVEKSARLGRQRGNNCIDNHSLLPLS